MPQVRIRRGQKAKIRMRCIEAAAQMLKDDTIHHVSASGVSDVKQLADKFYAWVMAEPDEGEEDSEP